jgi:hypothetical protein
MRTFLDYLGGEFRGGENKKKGEMRETAEQGKLL